MAAADPFFENLQAEMQLRARMLLGGRSRKAGRMLADDLVQEGMAKLIQSYGSDSLRERGHDTLMSLAYRTMRNLVIDQGRKKGEDLEDGDEDRAPRPGRIDAAPLADATVDRARRITFVREQLAGLSSEERCFVKHVIEHDSVPGAQRACGWPPKSPYYVLRQLFDRLKSSAVARGLGRGGEQ